MSEDCPFVVFSNAELAGCPRVAAGDRIACVQCGATHPLEETATPSVLLLFTCGESSYLAAIDGSLLPGHTVAEEDGR